MIESHDKVMSDYTDADFNQRLNIYLQYPQLRSEFIEIDQAERKVDFSTEFDWGIRPLLTKITEIIGSVASGVKKLVHAGEVQRIEENLE